MYFARRAQDSSIKFLQTGWTASCYRVFNTRTSSPRVPHLFIMLLDDSVIFSDSCIGFTPE